MSEWPDFGQVYNASKAEAPELRGGRAAHTAQLPIKAGALLQTPVRGFLATRSPLTAPSLQTTLFSDPGLCMGSM
jgi:hypothetical protein